MRLKFHCLLRCRGLRRLGCLAAIWCCALAGCNSFNQPRYNPPQFGYGPVTAGQNPIFVPILDRDFVWDQVVDVVDDYFRIAHEERVRLVGDLLTEGRIDTYPRGSSTLLEPWNKDSVDFYERLEATLQSTRRTALVRVIPAPAGYLVDVQVLKELENVRAPETGTISQLNSQALRNDSSVSRVSNPVLGAQPTLGWIPQGRDLALEQTMLANLQARLGGAGMMMPGATIVGPREF